MARRFGRGSLPRRFSHGEYWQGWRFHSCFDSHHFSQVVGIFELGQEDSADFFACILVNKKRNRAAAKSKAHLDLADIRNADASDRCEKWEREPRLLEGDRIFVDRYPRGNPLHQSSKESTPSNVGWDANNNIHQ